MVDSYPEYLNPFAEDVKPKSKLTIRNSFRQLGKNLRQSFRIKKKDEEDVTFRHKPVATLERNPISCTGPPQEALPRSRFRERISQPVPNSNPFDDEERQVKATVRRRGKKRAPLPPKSLSSQHLNVSESEISGSGSNWSLTSVDTEYSASGYDTERHLDGAIHRNSIVEDFVAFTKDMNTLTDDTNNNIVSTEEIKDNTTSKSNIPDIVVSCPSLDTVNTTLSIDDEKSDDCTLKTDDKKESPENTAETPEILENNIKMIDEDVKSLQLDDVEKKSVQSDDNDTDLVVRDISNNLITESEVSNPQEINEQDEILYYEKKSLYIAGSRDELNDSNTYTGRVSLFITGSCDDLDASNNNEVCNKIVTDENSNADAVPTPKQRKNKLSKNIVLGM